MKQVLYTCMGTTDPVRGYRDGPLLHIVRHYRPEKIYIFLSAEMAEMDADDARIAHVFSYIRSNWQDYSPEVEVLKNTELTDPSDMDAIEPKMNALLVKIASENPDAEILLNTSSGTPQMKTLMFLMSLDIRYRTRVIQVKNPQKKSGDSERTNAKNYSPEDELAFNEDEDAGSENRCSEPKLAPVKRTAAKERTVALVNEQNYSAIAEMSGELPDNIVYLAKHLALRSRFRLAEASTAIRGHSIPGLSIYPDRGALPQSLYEIVEYYMMLKILVKQKRYSDFTVRLNPFTVNLELWLLRKHVGTDVYNRLVTFDRGMYKVSVPVMNELYPGMRTHIEDRLGSPLRTENGLTEAKIVVLTPMLSFLGINAEHYELLKKCKKVNQDLRNPIAHQLKSISDSQLVECCGLSSQQILAGLEQILIDENPDYNLSQRLNVYERCDKYILEQLP